MTRLNALWMAMLAIGALTGCEQTVENPEDTLYVERLVVYGILEAGRPIDSILFTKTLPMTVPYALSDAALTDVHASIVVDGTSYPLTSLGGGYYRPTDLTAVSGKSYSLVATWREYTATATTRVPAAIDVDTILIDRKIDSAYLRYSGDTSYFEVLDLRLRPTAGQVNVLVADSLVYDDQHGPRAKREWFRGSFPPQRAQDTLADGLLHLTAMDYSYWTDTIPAHSLHGWVECSAYDEPYFDYFVTRPHSEGGDTFDPGGSPQTVRWNVHGDGIGMFLGVATKRVELK